jgi:hypothetical protein
VILVSMVVGLMLSFLTYWMGHLFACAVRIRGHASRTAAGA